MSATVDVLAKSGQARAATGRRTVDWRGAPALRWRGVLLDISSAADLGAAKIPTLPALKALAAKLASWKINMLQLYVENTFRFRRHPAIGRGYPRLAPAEVRELDAHCRRLGIELTPCFASFGHMEKILSLPRYRRLAAGPPWRLIVPGREDTYRFLDELYSEFLPCFSSGYFNVNGDETFDLGKGRSAPAVRKLGKGEVYLRHILRLHDLVTRKHGKRMMMWADIVEKHPDLIPRLPRDLTMLTWGYFNRWRPKDLTPFRRAGLDVIVCPGTDAYHSLSPWVRVSSMNISSACAAAREGGALGIMNTDWGDGGQNNPLGWSWYGLALGAAQAWSGGRTGQAAFDRWFSRAEFGDSRGIAAKLYHVLGSANEALEIKPVYRHWWYTVNWALLFYEFDLKGRLFREVTPAGIARLNQRAEAAGRFLTYLSRRRAGHPLLRRELGYSVRLLGHLAARLGWMRLVAHGASSEGIRAGREQLLADLASLRREFSAVWLARNRPQGREWMFRLYDLAGRFYRNPNRPLPHPRGF